VDQPRQLPIGVRDRVAIAVQRDSQQPKRFDRLLVRPAHLLHPAKNFSISLLKF
jgi:hypothetical protein